MHVVSLVFVGGGGCENLTEKLAVGVVGLTPGGGAPQTPESHELQHMQKPLAGVYFGMSYRNLVAYKFLDFFVM